MHFRTKRRILFYSVILLSIILGVTLILYNLTDNISFFLTPTDVLEKKLEKQVRLGGYVKNDSINKISIDKIEFELTDNKNDIKIYYSGPIPAIFRDNQGVVVTGKFDPKKQIFFAKELLAKHDEKYIPKNLKTDYKSNPLKE